MGGQALRIYHLGWESDLSLDRHRRKKAGQEICRAWDKAARLAKKSGLTPDAAREIIAAGVADVFATAMRETMPSGTVRLWCKMWLSEPPFIESTDCEC